MADDIDNYTQRLREIARPLAHEALARRGKDGFLGWLNEQCIAAAKEIDGGDWKAIRPAVQAMVGLLVSQLGGQSPYAWFAEAPANG